MEKELQHQLEALLLKDSGKALQILSVQSVPGGSINDAFRLDTTAGRFFLKTNSATKFPGMFEAELAGLNLLRETGTVKVPRVISTGNTGKTTWLLMEFLEAGRLQKSAWGRLGSDLASLHRETHAMFGLGQNNYMGSLRQVNTPHGTWAEFYILCRLEPQLRLAHESELLSSLQLRKIEHIFPRLSEIIPIEPPSLLHGDLWNGNRITGSDGFYWLIDPAVYYGHREADLAMTRLFGGFAPEFYDAYSAVFPLQSGYEQRVGIHNLYPLLIHLNLFGTGYLGQVMEAVNSI